MALNPTYQFNCVTSMEGRNGRRRKNPTKQNSACHICTLLWLWQEPVAPHVIYLALKLGFQDFTNYSHFFKHSNTSYCNSPQKLLTWTQVHREFLKLATCVSPFQSPPPPKLIVLDYCLKSHAWAENSLLCIVIASISYCNVTGSKQCIAGLEWTKLVTRSIRALVTHSLQPLGAYNYMCICSELTTASTSPHATWVKWSFSCGLCS